MGFFDQSDFTIERKRGAPSAKLLHDLSCSACPLNHADVRSPKMQPTGSKTPDVLILGEAPGETEDQQGKQFVGKSGDLLRPLIPREWLPRLAWDNAIRDRPPNNRTPTPIELECCRPNIVKSVEAMKPKAIFGFGGVPLKWATGEGLISNWRGRRLPVRIGNHTCWYFAFNHPSFLLHLRDQLHQRRTDEEHIFALDVKRAFASFERLPPPIVHDKATVLHGADSVLSCSHESAMRVVKHLREASESADVVGVDFECSSLRPYWDDIRDGPAVLASMAVTGKTNTLSWLLDHPAAAWAEKDRDAIIDAFVDFIHAPKPIKTSHNLAMELEWIGGYFGHEHVRAGNWQDSISQAFVLDQRKSGTGRDDDEENIECYGLGFLSLLYFGVDIKSLSNVNRKRILETPPDKLLPYNGVDAKYHKLLFKRQRQELIAQRLQDVYEKVHLPRVATCVLTQLKGIPLDFAAAAELKDKYETATSAALGKIEGSPDAKAYFRRFGKHLNPGSDKQVAELCRDILGSRAGEVKDRDGKVINYKADKSVLKKIDKPITNNILEWRTVEKLASTYIFDQSNEYVWPDNMLHVILAHARARTSRLTCFDPNGQNWPKRNERQKEVRKQVAALLDHLLLSLDFGQIEARVFAMLSRDKNYCDMLWADFDIHTDWARRIAYEFPHTIGGIGFINDKTAMKKFRDTVKGGWVFALFFDAMLSTACRQVGIEEDDKSRRLEGQFWAQFPDVLKWKEATHKSYEKNGYVELMTGRRRYGPMKRNAVINTPVQGCLQGHVRVWTKNGLIPIRELVGKHFDVWTGFEWATAVGLDRGYASLVRITLEDGTVIDCDARHFLKSRSATWQSVSRIKAGDFVALPDVGPRREWSGNFNWPYFLGAYVADGSFYLDRQGCPRFGLIGGYTKEKERKALLDSLHDMGFVHAYWRVISLTETRSPKFCIVADGVQNGFYDALVSAGATPGATSRTKRVPYSVWLMDEQDRADFLRGYFDGDGARAKWIKNNVHSPNLALLQDIQRLSASCGYDSAIHGYKTETYILRFHQFENSRRVFPREIFSTECSANASVVLDRGAFQKWEKIFVLTSRTCVKSKSDLTQSFARRLYREFSSDKEFYRYSRVRKIEHLGLVAKTYTLSVDDPKHQFVADGVIHKNTACEIVIDGMNRVSEKVEWESHPILQIHDDLIFHLPEKDIERYAEPIISEMLRPTFDFINVPLMVEGSVGANWLEMSEFGKFKSTDWWGKDAHLGLRAA